MPKEGNLRSWCTRITLTKIKHLTDVVARTRKFLDGKQNGVKPKAKQSTLAFSQKQAETTTAKKVEQSLDADPTSGVDIDEATNKTGVNGNKADSAHVKEDARSPSPSNKLKRDQEYHKSQDEDDDSDDQPVVKRRKRNSDAPTTVKHIAPALALKSFSTETSNEEAEPKPQPGRASRSTGTATGTVDHEPTEAISADADLEGSEDDAESATDDEKAQVAAKKREALQSTITSAHKDPYPDWKAGDPVPYAALCTTFSLIEMTTKRLQISAHCSLFLQQVLRLTPNDLLPTVQLMINKVAADYAGIELGIGESLIIKAISGSTGRPLSMTKADHQKIGDLGLVAAKSRSTQGTMFKPKVLTVRGVHEGLLAIAKMEGHGSQGKKVGAIKKLLAAADAVAGNKGIDINKDKGGASESKFLVRFLEGKLRLGLAEKTVIVALAHAMVTHELAQHGNKVPSAEQLAKAESTLKLVYR